MEVCQLKEVATIHVGYQSRKSIKEDPSGDYYLIQGRDFNFPAQIRVANCLRFNPERNPDLYSVHKGDLLFLARGSVHFAYYFKENHRNALASSAFYIIRIRSKSLLPSYLAWWINQPPAQNYLKSQTGGSLISLVTKNVLSQMEIRIPELPIQEKIGMVLNLWEKERVLINQLAQRRELLLNKICMAKTNDKER